MNKISLPTLPDYRLTSPYGKRTHPITGEVGKFHSGLDMAPKIPGTTGVPIFATQDGIVRNQKFHSSMGNYIFLEHTGDSYTSIYMHMARATVSSGTTVKSGQQIGIMGTTGSSNGIHLHFSVATSFPPNLKENGNTIDPAKYLSGAVGGGGSEGITYTPISKNAYLSLEEMTNNAEYICAYLSQKGWTKNAIAGFLGNSETESTINPGLWQNLSAGNLSLGLGIAQWTPATKIINFAKDNGFDDYLAMDTQLEKLIYDSQNGLEWISTSAYPLSYLDFTVSTESPEYLAQAFLKNYERPKNQNQPARSTQARYWFDNLKCNGGTAGSGGTESDTGKKDKIIDLLLCGALNGLIY